MQSKFQLVSDERPRLVALHALIKGLHEHTSLEEAKKAELKVFVDDLDRLVWAARSPHNWGHTPGLWGSMCRTLYSLEDWLKENGSDLEEDAAPFHFYAWNLTPYCDPVPDERDFDAAPAAW
jgi:hypothetical protein